MQTNYKEVLIMLIGGSIIFFVLTSILIFVILFYQKKKFRHANQLLEINKLHAETLLISQIEIQEETFKNISEEIHDNIGQTLWLLKLNLKTIPALQDSSINKKIEESSILVSKIIKDLRDVAKSINTDFVERIGLATAVEQQLTILQKTEKFETTIEEHGEAKALGKRNELIIFRVVQELLNNILKHANATTIKVNIYYDTGTFRLNICDNGKGFNIDTVKQSKGIRGGLGLSNMLNRITLLNGKLDIHSVPNKGTNILIEVPWQTPSI